MSSRVTMNCFVSLVHVLPPQYENLESRLYWRSAICSANSYSRIVRYGRMEIGLNVDRLGTSRKKQTLICLFTARSHTSCCGRRAEPGDSFDTLE